MRLWPRHQRAQALTTNRIRGVRPVSYEVISVQLAWPSSADHRMTSDHERIIIGPEWLYVFTGPDVKGQSSEEPSDPLDRNLQKWKIGNQDSAIALLSADLRIWSMVDSYPKILNQLCPNQSIKKCKTIARHEKSLVRRGRPVNPGTTTSVAVSSALGAHTMSQPLPEPALYRL